MNISEFERTKPTETMKALNDLIKKVDKLTDNSTDMLDILKSLKDIKEKLKRGE